MSEHLPHQHQDAPQADVLESYLDRTTDFQIIASLFKQLADRDRLRIFWLLCHCEECTLDLGSMTGASPSSVAHHLRQLKESGLVVSRRAGREVLYRAAPTEQCQLLHQMIERTMEIACPEQDDPVSDAPHLLEPDRHADEGIEGYPADQIETIHRVHDLLTERLDRRITIEELSRRFLMNPSTLKELFRAVYGNSLAAHIREHRMEAAARLLRETGDSMAQIARAVGYENQSKFSAEFRRVFHMLPTEYRRQRR